MKRISYKDYFDKVFGCWLGKCISGTIGAPFEGRKELFDYKFDTRSIEKMLPNDDLDLQVLWLEVLEKKGIHFKTEDLADAFLSKCPYAPGEYAVFKKNYKRGIQPPLSGIFNNSYYLNGNGCPIRSEIWGCINPGNPALATQYSWKDGIMDHGEDSVEGEAFYASMEAAAFFESDLSKLMETGLSNISTGGKVYTIVKNVIEWFEEGFDWEYTRELIINHYGHPDCTNFYQNLGFTVLSLLYGKGDFMDSTMLGLNCGFDTDCTCATVGAVLGIIYGAEALTRQYGFKDPGYVLGVDTVRRSDLLYDLAEDTCRVGLTIAREQNLDVEIFNNPEFTPVPCIQFSKPLDIAVEYMDGPAIGIGEQKRILVRFKNNRGIVCSGIVNVFCPDGWICNVNNLEVNILSGSEVTFPFTVFVPEKIETLYETNILKVIFTSKDMDAVVYEFGIVGAAVWKLYGPFWDNNIPLPGMNYWESYYPHIEGKNDNETQDITRTYHLNTVVDIDKQYMGEPDMDICGIGGNKSPSFVGKVVNTYTDKFSINDLVGYQGPCVVYMLRYLLSPEERNVCIYIGNTDAYKFWLNDSLVGEVREVDWCTNENRHFLKLRLNKGVNKLLFKFARRGPSAEYSMIFNDGGFGEHITEFGSKNP